jgi:hypothetical protein
LKTLDLKRNCLNVHEGALNLAIFVRRSIATIDMIDISYNSLSFSDILLVRDAVNCKIKGTFVNVFFSDFSHTNVPAQCARLFVAGNCGAIELWNAVSHGIGVILSSFATLDMFYLTYKLDSTVRIACIVYCASAIFLFAGSTLYHSMFLLPAAN